MRIGFLEKEGLCVAVVDNLYTAHEVEELKQELLNIKHLGEPPEICGSALDDFGKTKKKGDGVWLDYVFAEDRTKSKVLTYSTRLFSPEIHIPLTKRNAFFGHIANSNSDATLVNFYTNGGEYKQHFDTSMLTAITYFKFGNYNGGNLCFGDYNVEIECLENRTLIFPGCVSHGVVPVQTGTGFRVSVVKFINYRDERK